MQQLVNDRWFTLADLILVFIFGVVVTILPQYGGWLILLLLLPWLVRLLSGRITLERSALVYPITLVVVTAGIGVWAAYDRQAAWEKFWIIIGSVAILAALVNQPRVNLGVVVSLVGLLGVIIVIILILINDWTIQSSDFVVIKRVGNWIMASRPSPGNLSISPNFVGGWLAILAPIVLALGFYSLKEGNITKSILSFGMGLVVFTGLFLTSSRGAWLALTLGMGVWVLWRVSHYLSGKTKQSPQFLFAIILLIILIPSIWVVASYAGGLVGLANSLPGLPSGESRLDLALNTSKLIGDYPFTGGGLRSFPGLYSQYIMVTPYFLFSYSHNFYLDVILEQGFVGGIAILVVILGGAWMLINRKRKGRGDLLVDILSEAVLVSILVLLVHGFVDDPLYGDAGTPLLLLLPGLALMLVQFDQPAMKFTKRSDNSDISRRESGLKTNRLVIAGIFLILILSFGFMIRKSLLARWHGNLGAVDMARWELENWPQDRWNDNPDVSPLEHAEIQFNKALSYSPYQRTAWHRLGLVSMQRRDFSAAQPELERAFEIDPNHRGIRKSLGYAYVWGGELERATLLLDEIKEAKREMKLYSRWWKENDRPDLSNQANEMVSFLETNNQ